MSFGRVPRERYPWWVKFSLLGASSRASQWVWVGASIIAGVACLALAATEGGLFRIFLFLAGAWGFVAAGLYYATIRWMDRHGTWN